MFNLPLPEFLITLFLSLLNGALLVAVGYKFLQIIQLTGYKLRGFYSWMKTSKQSYFSRILFLSILSFACLFVTNVLLGSINVSYYFSYIGLIFYFYFASVYSAKTISAPTRVPLRYTSRMTRLSITLFILSSFASFWLIVLSSQFNILLRFSVVAFTPLLLYLLVPLAFYINKPLEFVIYEIYILKAKNSLKKLEGQTPKVKIGITGSFGKTSTKFILSTILSEKYKVCASPASYNTPMGLTKVILNNLSADDEIFIAEMGARRKGDIKKLCKLVKPDISVVTGVGEQHLETFKTIDRIKETKFEIVENMQANGKAFFSDSEISKQLFNKANCERYICGLDEGSFAYASDIEYSSVGASFTLVIDGKSISCQTKLMGKHNVSNIVLASAVAYKLGLTLDEIKLGISRIKPISHRLELTNAENGVIILDDSYNASTVGARCALEVLASITAKNKIVMTPGIVEQGKNQFEVNKTLGKEISKVATKVFVMNEVNKKAISEGLIEAGFNKENIFYATTITEGEQLIKQHVKKGDVLLIENDLPDNFI